MSREIKFRAWHQELGLMYTFPRPFIDGNTSMETVLQECGFKKPIKWSEFEIMQYTGLHDRNGVEIYEGDIVEREVYDRPYSKKQKRWKIRCVVEWRVLTDKTVGGDPINTVEITARPVKGQKDGMCDWSRFYRCEVIGNIYENPERFKEHNHGE